MSEDPQGRRFGKYRLLERIGSGGMAEIWKASLGGVDGFEKILVVKKILPKYARHRQFITMFVQEAKVCSGLHHANVVQIYELGEEAGEYYIAMEYVPGCDLLKLLTSATKVNKPPPPELCLFILTEVCKGLGYAHAAADAQGKPLDIVHLDVSPSNILLSHDGEVKLTDFGVAKAAVEGQSAAVDDRLKGKLGYMSPEQVTGKTIDHRSDIFSVGIILYELFTLKRLFLGKTDIETLSNIRDANVHVRLSRHPEVPTAVAEIIRRALTRNPDTRFQTAFEMEDAISQYLFERRVRVTPMMLSAYLSDLLGGVERVALVRAGATDLDVDAPFSSDQSRPIGSRGAKTHQDPEVPSKAVTPPGLKRPVFQANSGAFRLKSDKSEFGPVSYHNLRDLLQAHAVSPGELVSVDGSDWVPLAEVPGLTALMPASLRYEAAEPRDAGRFGVDGGVRLLARLARAKDTGRLKLVRPEARKEVWFRRGKPVHISSTNKAELLGAHLLSRGAITQAQLDEAFDGMRTDGGPIGTALVRAESIDHGQLQRELELQFREKFIQVIAWQDAAYEFFADQELGPEVVPFSMDPFEGITIGVRRHLQLETLEAYFEPRLDRTVKLQSVSPFDVTRLKLVPREQRVLNLLAARPITVQAVLQSVSAEQRQTVFQVLYLLHETEHIRIG